VYWSDKTNFNAQQEQHCTNEQALPRLLICDSLTNYYGCRQGFVFVAVMGLRIFGTVCLLLAALFTIAAIRGIIENDFSMVFVVPAAAAVALIIMGIRNFKST
jgi:hypothetical protein